jgi:hypothetical protein
MRVECLTCHGTYDTVLPDGTLYFHRCPPLSGPELREALRAGAVQLPPADAARLQAADEADRQHPPEPGTLARSDAVLASLLVERPQVRDENLSHERDAQGRPRLKADGLGTRPVP